jgi:hypothetical protein
MKSVNLLHLVNLSASISADPDGRNFVKFNICDYYESLLRNSRFYSNGTKILATWHEGSCVFVLLTVTYRDVLLCSHGNTFNNHYTVDRDVCRSTLLRFDGYANAPWCYVTRTLHILSSDMLRKTLKLAESINGWLGLENCPGGKENLSAQLTRVHG